MNIHVGDVEPDSKASSRTQNQTTHSRIPTGKRTRPLPKTMNYSSVSRLVSRAPIARRVPTFSSSSLLHALRFAHTDSKSPLEANINAKASGSTTASPTTLTHPGRQLAPKPKPNKSPSSLKRTASASQAIRSNPTPTRGAIRPVYTFATAEKYDLQRLRRSLPDSTIRFEEALWVPLTSANAGGEEGDATEVWVFRNGTVVCWGLEEDAARAFVEQLVNSSPSSQISPLKVVETEELEFVVDPAE